MCHNMMWCEMKRQSSPVSRAKDDESSSHCTKQYCAMLCSIVTPYTVLYCTVLYCAVLYCTVLCCTVLCCTVLYCTVLYCTIVYMYYTLLYYTILYYTILYYTILYYTVLYYTVLERTVLCCTVLLTLLRSLLKSVLHDLFEAYLTNIDRFPLFWRLILSTETESWLSLSCDFNKNTV